MRRYRIIDDVDINETGNKTMLEVAQLDTKEAWKAITQCITYLMAIDEMDVNDYYENAEKANETIAELKARLDTNRRTKNFTDSKRFVIDTTDDVYLEKAKYWQGETIRDLENVKNDLKNVGYSENGKTFALLNKAIEQVNNIFVKKTETKIGDDEDNKPDLRLKFVEETLLDGVDYAKELKATYTSYMCKRVGNKVEGVLDFVFDNKYYFSCTMTSSDEGEIKYTLSETDEGTKDLGNDYEDIYNVIDTASDIASNKSLDSEIFALFNKAETKIGDDEGSKLYEDFRRNMLRNFNKDFTQEDFKNLNCVSLMWVIQDDEKGICCYRSGTKPLSNFTYDDLSKLVGEHCYDIVNDKENGFTSGRVRCCISVDTEALKDLTNISNDKKEAIYSCLEDLFNNYQLLGDYNNTK